MTEQLLKPTRKGINALLKSIFNNPGKDWHQTAERGLTAAYAAEGLTEAPKKTRYIATNEPQTDTGEPNIINGILLMKPEDVVALVRRRHAPHVFTDQQAIDEYMAVNWGWWWEI